MGPQVTSESETTTRAIKPEATAQRLEIQRAPRYVYICLFYDCVRDVQLVTQLPRSRRQVHDVLSAAESVPPISDTEVTCGPMRRPGQHLVAVQRHRPTRRTSAAAAAAAAGRTDFARVAVLAHARALVGHAHCAPGVSAHALGRVELGARDAVVDAVVLVPLAQREPRTDRVPAQPNTAHGTSTVA